MATYVHLSRIYLSDEELYELISPKNVGKRELLRMGRLRGHIFSEKANDADVRSKLSMLPSDWKMVSDVLISIARPDPEERKSSVKVVNCEPDNDLVQIVTKLQSDRGAKNGEVFNPIKSGDKTVRVEVAYTDIDLSRSVVYHRRKKTLSIEVVQKDDTVHFLYNANERALQIVDAMKALLSIKPDLQMVEERVSLSGIRDAVLRTKFFTQLIKTIAGYKYQNATYLTVDRRLVDATDGEGQNGESQEGAPAAKKNASVMKGMVNKVSLDGEQVIATDLYQQAAKTGYFITSIFWSCIDEKDARYHIDCEAGFNEPIKADQFSFDVVRRWQFSTDGRERQEGVAMTAAERRSLTDLLEAAAVTSLKKVMEEHQTRKDESQADVKPASVTS